MFFLKPVNISSVIRCKYLAVTALATFWASFFAFLLAPIWFCTVLFVLHVGSLYLLVGHTYRLLAFLVLSLGGEGAVPASANSAAATAPDKNETAPIT